ncbi:MAG: M20/M25/M40 family metallo-hydrolase, partial [Planctomycetota bacterium]
MTLSLNFNKSKCLELIKQLAVIPAPSLGEGPRCEALIKWLKEQELSPYKDSAGSVWLEFGQGEQQDTVIFDAHIDVVKQGFAESVIEKDGKLSGLGVGDNLAHCVILALFAKEIKEKEAELKQPLKIIFSVGEEGKGGLKGMLQMIEDNPLPPHAFISFDPSFENYCLTGLGSRRFKVEVKTAGGHSWSNYGRP